MAMKLQNLLLIGGAGAGAFFLFRMMGEKKATVSCADAPIVLPGIAGEIPPLRAWASPNLERTPAYEAAEQYATTLIEELGLAFPGRDSLTLAEQAMDTIQPACQRARPSSQTPEGRAVATVLGNFEGIARGFGAPAPE